MVIKMNEVEVKRNKLVYIDGSADFTHEQDSYV